MGGRTNIPFRLARFPTLEHYTFRRMCDQFRLSTFNFFIYFALSIPIEYENNKLIKSDGSLIKERDLFREIAKEIQGKTIIAYEIFYFSFNNSPLLLQYE